jgi:hypothetical protein
MSFWLTSRFSLYPLFQRVIFKFANESQIQPRVMFNAAFNFPTYEG